MTTEPTNRNTGAEGWYAPLARETAPVEAPVRPKKRRGWTPWRVLGVISLVLLLIAGSSLAFSVGGSQTVQLPQPRVDKPSQRTEPETTLPPTIEEFPDDWREFFSDFYTGVDTEKTDIRIDQAALPIDFELSLTAPGEELSLQALYASCAESIVGVAAYAKGETGYFWGTGVVLSEDGLILTNTHVINNTDRAVVTLWNDEEYEAQLVGADGVSDLAVLKIEASGLHPAVFGQSDRLAVGQPVAAIGNPLGEEFRSTLTDGIISAIDRDVDYRGRTMTLLQTNTALNEGNSGGALYNMSGQVIGITNMKMMSSLSSIEGIGFAIPSATVQRVVRALVSEGEVRGRPAIGITVGAIPEEAMERYELPEGLYVTDVSRGSDAEKQGVRAGDVLLAVDGIPVTTTVEVKDIKDAHEVGEQLVLTIWREGETLEITITLGDTNDIYGK